MIVNPQSSHRVIGSRIDAHGNFVGILTGNPVVDIEKVAVLLANCIESQPVNRIGKVQVHALSVRPHTASFIAYFLCVSRGDVAGYEVAKTRITVLEVVVALTLGDV